MTALPPDMLDTIIPGDCIEGMRRLPDGSAHMIVTSPPYWGLRDYGGWAQVVLWDGDWSAFPQPRRASRAGWRHRVRLRTRAARRGIVYAPNGTTCLCALGLEPTPELYIAHMVAVFREAWRVLRDDGTLWLNIGDSYNANQGTGFNGQKRQDHANRHTVMDRPDWLKPKDLVGIPWMLAFALRADGAADWRAVQALERIMMELADAYEGQAMPDRVRDTLDRLNTEWRQAKGHSWYLRQEIIWHKPNPMPESTRDRCTKAHESVFLLTKRPRYFYDADAIREPNSEGAVERFGENHAISVSNRKAAGLDGKVRAAAAVRMPDWLPNGRNKRSVWTIPTAPYAKAHFATFPPKLVEPCILAGTSAKGCCPVCGAPWERVTERATRLRERPNEYVKRGKDDGRETGNRINLTRDGVDVKTTGWRPTCEHGAEPVPCIVLDPFGGSGTVGRVARDLGRHYILCELSADYIELARERIAGAQPPLFAGGLTA